MKDLAEVVASSHSAPDNTPPVPYLWHQCSLPAFFAEHPLGRSWSFFFHSFQLQFQEPHFLSKLPSVPLGWSRWTISTRSRRWLSRRLSTSTTRSRRLSTSTRRGRRLSTSTRRSRRLPSTTTHRRLSTPTRWCRWTMVATASTTSDTPNPSPFYHPPTIPAYPTSSLPNPTTSLPYPTSSTNSRSPSNSPCSCRGDW